MDDWREFKDDDDAFHSWLDAHPDGYFLNIVPSKYPAGILHSADCYHFDRGDSSSWTTTKKVCGETQSTVERYASERFHAKPERCDCLSR